jgi:hypothetical protein
MRYQDVTFTISPTGGNYTAKLCYTCRTPAELESAKNAIVDCFDTIGEQWEKESHHQKELLSCE